MPSTTSAKTWPNHEIGHIIVFLMGFCSNEQGFANNVGCQLAPSPPSCLQNRITNLVKMKKKSRSTFELACISGENDASGYHCKAESASPDPLFALAHSTTRTICSHDAHFRCKYAQRIFHTSRKRKICRISTSREIACTDLP